VTQQKKLVQIVTSPMTAWAFLRGQLRFMKERGFDVTLISAPGWELEEIAKQEECLGRVAGLLPKLY